MKGVQEITPVLNTMIESIEKKWEADNPITRGSVKFEIQGGTLKKTEFDAIMAKLEALERPPTARRIKSQSLSYITWPAKFSEDNRKTALNLIVDWCRLRGHEASYEYDDILDIDTITVRPELDGDQAIDFFRELHELGAVRISRQQ